MEYKNNNRPDVNLKFLNSSDVYTAIQACNSKRLKVTYCSLKLDSQCINTKSIIMKINKLHTNCDFIEGTILKEDKPFEDIVLKASSILQIECVKDKKPNDNISIYDTIKYCDGLVKITQCSKLEKGKCVSKSSFYFLVTKMDSKNKVIKGYRIRQNHSPEYMVLDESLILDIECITKENSPNFPWWVIPMLMNSLKN